MKIEIRKSAIKDLDRLNPKDKIRISSALRALKNFPHISNIKRLVDFDYAYRLRVGAYRVLFDVQNDAIFIARVLHRKDSYK